MANTGTPSGEHEDLKERTLRAEMQILDLQKHESFIDGKFEALLSIVTANTLAFELFRKEINTGLMKQMTMVEEFLRAHVIANDTRAKESDGRLTTIEDILRDNGTFRAQFGVAVRWVLTLLGAVISMLIIDTIRRWK